MREREREKEREREIDREREREIELADYRSVLFFVKVFLIVPLVQHHAR